MLVEMHGYVWHRKQFGIFTGNSMNTWRTELTSGKMSLEKLE